MSPNARHTHVNVRDVAEIVARALEEPVAARRRYLAGNETLSMVELNTLVSELADVPMPRLPLPVSC